MTMNAQKIRRRNGIAGQFSLSVDTEDGRLEFVSDAYGAPIVLVLPSGSQTFVSNPERFGSKLNEEWVRNFLSV